MYISYSTKLLYAFIFFPPSPHYFKTLGGSPLLKGSTSLCGMRYSISSAFLSGFQSLQTKLSFRPNQCVRRPQQIPWSRLPFPMLVWQPEIPLWLICPYGKAAQPWSLVDLPHSWWALPPTTCSNSRPALSSRSMRKATNASHLCHFKCPNIHIKEVKKVKLILTEVFCPVYPRCYHFNM